MTIQPEIKIKDGNDFIDAEYLMELHPELSQTEAEELRVFAEKRTIRLVMCYGDGSIMYPMWMKSKEIKEDLCSCFDIPIGDMTQVCKCSKCDRIFRI